MTNEISTISLAVDSSRVVKAKRDLTDFAAAGTQVERSAGGMEQAVARMGRAFGAAVAGFSLQAVVQQADAFANLSARLRLVTKSTEEFAQAQAEIFRIAQQSGTGLSETADLYGALARSTETLGASQRQVLGVTETINRALVVSGSSAQASSAALLQLGQAFSSGVLRGEELNSVLEQAPRLARAIADGLNVTVGSLRVLGEQGQLTSKDVFEALQKSASSVRAEFDQMPLTVGRASTEAANSLLVLIGAIDGATGASAALANSIRDRASAFAELAKEIQAASVGQETSATAAGIIAQAFQTASETVRILYANVEFVFRGIGREIGAVAAQITALATLNIDGFTAISRAVRDDAERARAELEAFERRVINRYNFPDVAGAGRGVARDPRVLGTPDPITPPRRVITAAPKGAGGAKNNEADQIAKAQLAADLSAIRDALNERTALYQNSERALAALRQTGVIDEREYLAAKRQLVQLESQAEIGALEAERARLRQQKTKGKAEDIQQRQRLAEIESRLAIERGNAAAKLVEIDIQQAGALQQLARAYQAAEQAARDLLEAQALQQARAVDSIGLSDRQRDRVAGRQQIEDRYQGQRQALEEKRLTQQINAEQYAEELDRIRRFQAASLASYEAYYDRLIQAQGNWANGVSRSLQNYIDEAGNTARTVEQAMTNGLQGMEDALVRFVTTGKLSFTDLANSVLADITRIIIKQTIANQLAAAMGSGGSPDGFLGSVVSSLFGGGRANGGPVQAGRLYEVNESGRWPGELLNLGGRQYLIPNANGSVDPNRGAQAAPQAPGLTQNISFVVQGAIDRRTQQQIAVQTGRAAQSALARNG